MILSLKNVSFRYNDQPILDQVDFVVNEKEKWGVVGVNGSGKSTFLKLLAQQEKPDSGDLTILKKYRISYCPQEMEFNNDLSIYQTIANRMKQDTELYQIHSILNRLGFTNHDENIATLSGGQKKKVALAISLIQEADLYLLDEPTNHLDQDMILWLEDYLNKSNKAIVIITHDRYFLSRITDHMVEIADGKLYCYQGNYADYLQQREIRHQQVLASEAKRQNFLRREIQWIRAGCPARSTKSQSRIDNYERIAAIQAPKETETLQLKSASSRLGKKIMEIHDLAKAYDQKVLFKDFSYNLLRDDRIGIIGNNGCGKTTLLSIFAGQLKPDAGYTDLGETVKIGYFAQHNITFKENQKVLEYLKEFGEVVQTADGERITAGDMLERFLFPKEMQYLPISKLSGGEKRRLYLCSVLMQAPNLLLLDEPTNDFDTDTITILENYLEDFNGPVIAVSHDRYFIDKTCDKLLAFEDGNINVSLDSYSNYIASHQPVTVTEVKETKVVNRGHNLNQPSSKEKNEFHKIEQQLPKLEEEIKNLEEQLNQTSDYQTIREISTQLDAKRDLLDQLTERWMELADKF